MTRKGPCARGSAKPFVIIFLAVAAIYAWVQIASAMRARRQVRRLDAYVWERDDSSRPIEHLKG